ncbi:class I SAM-dependent methyltransferase [Pseudanabaena sp. PCC 6802]|uniref:class I SAM-dependent methyltransferase n=1 Tax=Pseudanabaena sp. PCC 6802 TaxID=118173 RepID=UPI00034A2725|nr:class I SAM-dependent methyltransferase [Pseudanabaena sp. PCC 6802]
MMALDMSTEAKIKFQYDRIAKIYDRRWHSYIRNTLTFLMEHIHLGGHETILDVACGTGELERLLLATYPQVKLVGVDISEQMLEIARSKFTARNNIEFLKASAIALPFPNASFDIVVTSSAFHYFEHPIPALQEIRRVLRSNGTAIVLDWCRDFWSCQALDFALKLIDPAYRTCYTQTELHGFLNAASFDVTAARKKRLYPLWGMMVATGNPIAPSI